MTLSVIIPTLNEAEILPHLLAPLRAGGVSEILVVDGGSHDGTPDIARKFGVTCLPSTRRRASQLNRGTAAARGDWLWFLHADTALPADWQEQLRRAMEDPAIVGGGFHSAIDAPGVGYRLLDVWGWLRTKVWRSLYGDQGIFVRRDLFERLGGFAELPGCEDVEFSRRMQQAGRVAVLPGPIRPSARRWQRNGWWRTVTEHMILVLRYELMKDRQWLPAYVPLVPTTPSVHPAVVTVMQEKGFHLEGCRPKGFAQLPADPFDVVVTMGCGDACPVYPGARRIDRVIPDPKDQPIERVRQIRDEIEYRVQQLLRELSASLQADRQKQRSKGWFGRSIFAIGLSFLLVGAPRSAGAVTPEGHELIGTSAAEWHVSDWFNSAPISLKQLRGKVVLVRWWTGRVHPRFVRCHSRESGNLILIFMRMTAKGTDKLGMHPTGPECSYCAASAPNLDAWYHRYHAKGLEIIGFYHHKSPTSLTRGHVQRLVGRYQFRFPVAIDPGWRTLKRWWLDGHDRAWTSVSFLIDQQGIIRYVHPGGSYSEQDAREIESMIQGLLEGHSDAV